MVRFFVKSEKAVQAAKAAGRNWNGVYLFTQQVGADTWHALMREDGVGIMAPWRQGLLLELLRDRLLNSEAWAV